MKKNLLYCHSFLAAGFCLFQVQGQQAPFSPEEWPATINPNASVHYIVTDDGLPPPGLNWWQDELTILSGGDQVTTDITIGGHQAVQASGNYLNTADFSYFDWADDDTIDILMQVYGNEALFNTEGNPRNFNFLIGTLPELEAPVGGSIPVEAKNRQWNWVLFRIPNTIRPSDGTRRIGSIPANAQGNVNFGGVNGGTIRLENVPGLIVRVVAFGEVGAFGEPEQINVFSPPEECSPEPETNYAYFDASNNTSDHLEILNNGDQTVVFESNIGPDSDKRNAVRAEGLYMNFGITENYFGQACNDPRTMKICVEFYDDPNLIGVVFGPEAYATDAQGGIGFYPQANRHVLEGTGQWIRRSWEVPAVNLFGVNAAPLTAGPRMVFEGAAVYISRFDLAILRTGEHPLAGQDPLADCFEDPNLCTGVYGNYAELDLQNAIYDGLDVGNSGGDQEMIQEEAGPANDRRFAVRAAHGDGTAGFAHQYLNFAILDEKLGPSSQPNAHLAICVTYYDDPNLIGATFRPEVYIINSNGQNTFGFTPGDIAVPLEGTDTWREAYFEIPRIKFNGVNQGPQAAARFTTSDNIYFTRIRYGVIRPCGPEANVNPLEDCKPILDPPLLSVGWDNSSQIRLSWPSNVNGFGVDKASSLQGNPLQWIRLDLEPIVDGDNQYILLSPEGAEGYFRLAP